ncbi:MAG: response regulator [Pseudomonadota bacterium]
MTTVSNQQPHGPAPARPGAKQVLVLSVEDDASDAALISELVARRADVTLLSATHGGAGVKLARAHLPALILMDMNLPGLSGMDALGFLRNDPNTAAIPIIGLSSDAPRSANSTRLCGFFGYLTKPFKFEDFETMVDAALLHSAQRRQPAN